MARAFTWFCAFFLVLTCNSQALAAERLAVLELSGDLEPKERGLLTDTIRGAVVKALRDRVQVMTRENMEVMLTDMGLDADCVAEGACEVETARNLGVDYVVSGSIVGVGGILVASVKFHETKAGSLLGQEQARGADVIALMDALPASSTVLVSPLLAATPTQEPALAAAPAPAPVPEAQQPPHLAEPEPYNAEYAVLAQTKRLDAIARLKSLLNPRAVSPNASKAEIRKAERATPPSGATAAEMKYRLGELYFQEGAHLRQVEKHEGKETPWRRWYDQCVEVFNDIRANYAGYQRMSEVVFDLANAKAALGEDDEALQLYSHFLKNYPKSPFVPDARWYASQVGKAK